MKNFIPVFAVYAFVFAGFTGNGFAQSDTPATMPTEKPNVASTTAPSDLLKSDSVTPDGVGITVLQTDEPRVRDGDYVTLDYVLRTADGTSIMSTYLRKTPLGFQIGKGLMVKGLEQGIIGMAVGDMRRLVVPPELAWGDIGQPPKIGPGETVVFEVLLSGITRMDKRRKITGK